MRECLAALEAHRPPLTARPAFPPLEGSGDLAGDKLRGWRTSAFPVTRKCNVVPHATNRNTCARVVSRRYRGVERMATRRCVSGRRTL